jgi:polyisoprenoid-binding protein YceI
LKKFTCFLNKVLSSNQGSWSFLPPHYSVPPAGSTQRNFAKGSLALLLVLTCSTAALAEPKTLKFDQSTAAYKGKDALSAWTGTTKDVNGTVEYDSQTGEFIKGEVQVGLASIDSGNGVRDARMRNEFLQTDKFPTALFVVKKIENFPKFSAWKQWGNRQKGKIIGDLTIKNITKPVTFEAEAIYTGKELKVTGTSKVKMTDYGITPPSLFLVTVEDSVGLEFDALAKPMP